jgi:hypothetical protein
MGRAAQLKHGSWLTGTQPSLKRERLCSLEQL